MSVVLVPVIATSLAGLILPPALRMLVSSKKTKAWAKTRNAAQSRY
jgi:hypothetical protein